MANANHRWDSLHPVHHPDLHGWTVVGTDGRKIGQVRGLLADPHDDAARFLEVELDRTALDQDATPGGGARFPEGGVGRTGVGQAPPPGGGGRVPAGAYPADPNRPGSRPQADADPTVGESERTASLNTGARQHAADFTGAVPRADDG